MKLDRTWVAASITAVLTGLVAASLTAPPTEPGAGRMIPAAYLPGTPAAPLPSSPSVPAAPVAAGADGDPERTPPQNLEIPDLGLSMPVQAVGVRADGQMDVPENPAVVGWYRFGSGPLDPGATVLAAHVDSRRFGIGAFARLSHLLPGAEIRIATASGVFRYRVERLETIPKTDLIPALVFDRSGPARLHVLTCGGDFQRGRGWDSNVLVIATRLG